MENEGWAVQIVPFYKTKMVSDIRCDEEGAVHCQHNDPHPLSMTRRELYTGAAQGSPHSVTRRKLCTDSYKSAEEQQQKSDCLIPTGEGLIVCLFCQISFYQPVNVWV